MVLVASGLNYKKAGIEIRERMAFDQSQSVKVAQNLVAEGSVNEAIVISTCNRTELYCEVESVQEAMELLIGQTHLTYEQIKPYTYHYQDRAAVSHLMRVASGLDSMIFGETEILGQLKEAFSLAQGEACIGKHLGRLFQCAFSVAKRVRSETSIGENPISVASVAAKLSQRIFSDVSKANILLIGSGRLIQSLAKHLVGMGVKQVMVAARTSVKAEKLANEVGGVAVALEEIPRVLAKADMVITGTLSQLPIIGKGMLESALVERKRKPMFVVDLSVPRNVEPEVKQLEDIYLYTLDDLESIVIENKGSRQEAAEQAGRIIEQAADRFMEWLGAQESFRTLTVFREKFDKIRDEVLEENLNRLALGEDPTVVMERLAYTLTNRFLHQPTRRLRQAGLGGEEKLLKLVKDVFELEAEFELECETLYTE